MAAVVVVTGLPKGPLVRLVTSYALVRLQQISMMWKQDFTLGAKGEVVFKGAGQPEEERHR